MKRILILLTLLVAVCAVQADRRALLMSKRVDTGSISSLSDIPNLYALYKGDLLVTNTAGVSPPTADDFIAWWGDSSGNGNHLRTNNLHGVNPIWKSAAQTGRTIGGMQFSGTTNQLRVGFSTPLADSTIFALWRNASSGAYKIFVTSTNASNSQYLYKRNTDLFAISAGTEQTAAGAIPNPSWNVLCGVFNSSGNDSMYTNGVVVSTSLNAGNQSLDGLSLGANIDGTNPIGNGEYLALVAIYSRLLTSTEIAQASAYIAGL